MTLISVTAMLLADVENGNHRWCWMLVTVLPFWLSTSTISKSLIKSVSGSNLRKKSPTSSQKRHCHLTLSIKLGWSVWYFDQWYFLPWGVPRSAANIYRLWQTHNSAPGYQWLNPVIWFLLSQLKKRKMQNNNSGKCHKYKVRDGHLRIIKVKRWNWYQPNWFEIQMEHHW